MAQEETEPAPEAPSDESTPRPAAQRVAEPAPPPADDARPGEEGRFARLRKKLLEPRELGEDAKSLIGTVLDSSDRAKTEVVRMVAREVRHYLEELKLKDDLRDLITSHSLEIKASFHLKPLPGKEKAPTDPESE